MIEKLKFGCYMTKKEMKEKAVIFRVKNSNLVPYSNEIYMAAWNLAHYIEDGYSDEIINRSLNELNEEVEKYNIKNFYNLNTLKFIKYSRNQEYDKMYDMYKIKRSLVNNIIKSFIEKQERFDQEKGMYKLKDLKDLVWDNLDYERLDEIGYFEDEYVLFDESIEENIKNWIDYMIDHQINIVHTKLSGLGRSDIKLLIINKENEIFTPKKIKRDYL